VNRQTLHPMIRFGTKAGLALAVVSALALPLASQASSFQLPTDGAAGYARANAGGSLFANDPTAAFNNPAAMAFFTAPMIQVTGIGIRPVADFNGQFQDQQGKPVSGNNKDGFGKFVPFPNVVAVVPVNDRLSLGGSITVPYGLQNDYGKNWQGRYFGTETKLQSVAVSLSAGFKVNDEFSVGVGVMGQRTKAQLNSTLDPYGTAAGLFGGNPLAGAPQSGDVGLNVNVQKKFAFGYFGGFEWKPTQQDSVGLSYHSRVRQTLSGVYDVYGSAASKGLLSLGPALFPNAGLPTLNPNGDTANAELDTPAYASLSWLHAFNDRFSLAATTQWTNWANFQSLVLTSHGNTLLSIPENFKDSWSYSIGGDYKLTDQWTLRAGLGYDETPTNSATRDPRLPDGSRRIVGIGAGYQATDHIGFDVAYQHQFVGKVRVNQTNPLGLGLGTMNGTFDDHGDIVALTGTYKF